MKYLAPIFFMLLPGNPLMAQYPIELKNASFEDLPNASAVPVGWTPCGMSGETPPDIQPGFFGCELQPAEGRTYLGMVTRDNYTWESVSQQLPAPLDSGVCYTFTIQLAVAPDYHSNSRATGNYANYNEPVVFQVWGGHGYCDEKVLLGESGTITHHNWLKYRFIIRHLQAEPITHLSFQVYYTSGNRCKPTNGNLLLDDLSAIAVANCPTNMVDSLEHNLAPQLPVLASEEALDAILIRELASIRYENRDAVQCELQCAETVQGLAIRYSAHLLTVVEAMRQFPEKTLILRTKNANASTRYPRATFLKNYLRAAGLPEHQFQVMPAQKKEGDDWKVRTSWLDANW